MRNPLAGYLPVMPDLIRWPRDCVIPNLIRQPSIAFYAEHANNWQSTIKNNSSDSVVLVQAFINVQL
jgi:hypothetical protein